MSREMRERLTHETEARQAPTGRLMIAVCWNFAVSLGKDRCVFSSLPLRVATARAICPALF
jgi:hypothetical protein